MTSHAPFLFFWLAVVGTGIYAGFGPAVLAALLSAILSSYFLMPPLLNFSLELPYITRILLFMAVAIMVSYASSAKHRAAVLLYEQTRSDKEMIAVQLREKEILLKEINHRVKNNLQLISSVINLRSRTASQETQIALREVQNRIRSIAILHEKLYQSNNFADIDLEKYIQDLTSLVLSSYDTQLQRITVRRECEKITTDINTAVTCGLILNELICNCLKHAFPDEMQGEILIHLQGHNGRRKLSVIDNGIGIPQNIDLKTTDSMGLKLINLLVNQINGEIQVERCSGTIIEIYF